MSVDGPPPPTHPATTLAWCTLAPPALAALLRLGHSLLPRLSTSRPEAAVALLLCLGSCALVAWNLAWVLIASLAAARLVPRRVRHLLAIAVHTAGTPRARRMLWHAGAVAGLGAGLLSACSEAPAAAPPGDDLSWGAVPAVVATAAPSSPSTVPLPGPTSSPVTTAPAAPTAQAPHTPGDADADASTVPDTQGSRAVEATTPTHTVAVGDTLWGIAAGLLGPGADDAQTTRTWQRIHEHNRDVIGEDPDLILPGSVLSLDGILP